MTNDREVTIETLCQWTQPKPGGRLWVCPACEATATTDRPPGRRVCGPRTARPAKPVQQTTVRRKPDGQPADSSFASQKADPHATEREYRATVPACQHRGTVLKTEVPCQSCGQRNQVYDVYQCALHGICTLGARGHKDTRTSPTAKSCKACPDSSPLAPQEEQPDHERLEPLATPRTDPRPRVAFLSPSMYPGGAERWMISLARWLPQCGVNVVGAVITSPHLYHQSMAAEMRRWCPVTQASGPQSDQILSQADIVLVWGIGDLTPWLADYSARVVWVAHGSSEWTSDLIAKSAPRVDDWIGVSDKVRESFPADIAPLMNVIHNGADIERCTPMRGREATRKAWGVTNNQIVIGYLGRLSPEKRPLAAVEALAHLPDNYVAVIAGNGLDHHVQTYTREALRAAPGRVILPGYQAHVGDVLAGIDVWINASPSEGFSLSLIEAWLAGVPCVSTPTGAIPELEWEHNLLVHRVPIGATATELADAIRGTDDATAISDRARNLAWDHFTAASMAARWADYLTGIRDPLAPQEEMPNAERLEPLATATQTTDTPG